MKIEIKKISYDDSVEIAEFLKKFKESENGFNRPASDEELKDQNSFKQWLAQKINESEGINLATGHVQQTLYWILCDRELAGIGKVRPFLNPQLLINGGNIGYGVSPEFRSKGIMSEALRLLLRELLVVYEVHKVLITVQEDNSASRRVAEKNGFILKKIENGKCYYWVDLSKV